MTPAAIALYVKAHSEARLELYRERVAIAHLNASLSRIPATKEGNKAFPKLPKLLQNVAPKPKKQKTANQRALAMVEFFNSLPHTKKPLKIVKSGKVKK